MAQFKFRVQNIHGEYVSGIVEAANQDTALDILYERGYTVLTLVEKDQGPILNMSIGFLEKVKPKDMVIFSRQFSVLISATIPILEALQILVDQATNAALKKALIKASDDVGGGLRLSEAFGKHPKIFSAFYVNMIHSGEESGKLESALSYLADQVEHDYELTSRIRGAMIYPAAILSGLIIVAIIMMIFVVPKLLDIIAETEQELPFATRMLVMASDILTSYWWLILIVLAGLTVFFRIYTRGREGKEQWDLLKLYIPVFGPLFKKIYIVRITRSLSTLIAGGVNITRALTITADTVGNESFASVIRKTSEEVEGGNSIVSVIKKSPIFPSMVAQIMRVGEETGRLDLVLEKLTKFYTLEIDNTVRNMVALLEPTIILVMGGGVGLLVASIILPIFQAAQSF